MTISSSPKQDVIDPVVRSLELLSKQEGRTIVALAGFPGSGKSTLAHQVSAEVNRQLRQKIMLPLSMDGFHLTRETLNSMDNSEELFKRRGAPWTFDSVGFREKLLQVKHRAGGSNVTWPQFEHGRGDPVDDAIEVPDDVRLVLVEGLYVLYGVDGWQGIPDMFEERWFLNTSLETSLHRLARRHMKTRIITLEAAQDRIQQNDFLNAEIVSTTIAKADYFVYCRQ